MSKKIVLPTYRDGMLEVFRIKETSDLIPKRSLESIGLKLCYRDMGVFDKTKFELSQLNREITAKLRIPQSRDITAKHIISLNGSFHEVYNVYHFTDKEGFRQTDLTLIEMLEVL